MQLIDFAQIFLLITVLILSVPLVGGFMGKVFKGERHILSAPLGWLERLVYRAGGVDPFLEMNWKEYAAALLIFNALGFLVVFTVQLMQGLLPGNPQALGAVSWTSTLNTAVSFMTNTNWQGYAGETTLSYFTQMVSLTVQNFVSAATGFAVFLALVRGLVLRSGSTLGNFWTDLTRATVYVLLPLSLVWALLLVGQGAVQTFAPYAQATTLEGSAQTLPLGPAASQIAIKQLGTNGGGFFNANSAHPLENPTPFANFLEVLAILLLPAALTYTFGAMVGSRRQGWTLFAVMFGVWLFTLIASLASEYSVNPVFGMNALMEGKEVRLGVTNSVIWSTATTVASNGSVNAMHSSLSPLAGGLAMFNIMLGEVIFGGVGAGLYGMLLFVLLTVFLSGLMVGRSPEYLGKKIEAPEIKMAILGILGPCVAILIGASISVRAPAGLMSLSARGPHGLSEILYAFTSAAGNNGSAFAGLNANTAYYNLMLALAMLIGRFVVILPCLAIAGRMVVKKTAPPSAGTFATDTVIFGVLLTGVIVIVGALTFLPALSLGPIVEHFLMLQGRTF